MFNSHRKEKNANRYRGLKICGVCSRSQTMTIFCNNSTYIRLRGLGERLESSEDAATGFSI